MVLPSRCANRNHRSLLVLLLVISLAAAALILTPAHAKKRARHQTGRPYRTALLIEAETGQVLKAYNPRQREIPASLVKMMTILLTLEHVKEKTVSLKDPVITSRKASKIGGQQVYLAQGEQFPLEKLLQAVAISSANDAAYAVAEHVAGDVSTFIEMMNERARQLKMTDTEFVNVHGLPPGRRKRPNRMSARDAAILARELLKHPIVTRWGSTRNAPFRGGSFTLTNTNRLVGRFHGLDGLKTGSYRQAGYSIVATAKRGNLRLIAVVLSSDRPKRRFKEARKLLAWGFARYRWFEATSKSIKKNYSVEITQGQKKSIRLNPEGKFRTLVRRGQEMKIAVRSEIPDSLPAPVATGHRVGRIIYELKGKKMGEIHLTAAESVEKKWGFLRSLITYR
ncbi:MAG: D-alanyl-D-alanine carboxypeptidase family protein [bacterium]